MYRLSYISLTWFYSLIIVAAIWLTKCLLRAKPNFPDHCTAEIWHLAQRVLQKAAPQAVHLPHMARG
jgi:hypothetical protein